jgi:hypothetical protein
VFWCWGFRCLAKPSEVAGSRRWCRNCWSKCVELDGRWTRGRLRNTGTQWCPDVVQSYLILYIPSHTYHLIHTIIVM